MRLSPVPGPGRLVGVDPATAGWRYLAFEVWALPAGATWQLETGPEEAVLVFLTGSARATVEGQTFEIVGRRRVFTALPTALYLPRASRLDLTATTALEFALGRAPAERRYPVRLVRPEAVRVEIRGGANVTRRVSHVLAPDFPAERLLVVEVLTPSGNWSSFPPHRHDGRGGSPYLEEVYYYRIDPPEGFALQRLYTRDTARDEVVVARDSDLVLVPEGYHPVVAAPGSNVYYLNILAGETREMTPYDDPAYAWIRQDWHGRALTLPITATH